MKPAAGRDVGGVGIAVAEADIGDAEAGLGGEDRGEQRGCVGVGRAVEQRVGVGPLDDAAEIHHRHFVADVLDDRQVVADEHQGQAEVAAEVGQQVQDLRLDRDVERAGRLVADHDAGAHHQGTGDGHALALAARELGRQALALFGGETDAGQHLAHARPSLGVGHALGHQRHADDVDDPAARVERGERVLEHRLDQLCPLAAGHGAQGAAVDQDVAAGGGMQAEDQAGQRGLAAAGFADDAEAAAPWHRERNAVDGADHARGGEHAGALAEDFFDVADFDGRGHAAIPAVQLAARWHS